RLHVPVARRRDRGPAGDERLLRPARPRGDRRPPPRGPLGELAPWPPPRPGVPILVRPRRCDRARKGFRLRRVPVAALPLLAVVCRDAEPRPRPQARALRPRLAADPPSRVLAHRAERPEARTAPRRARRGDAPDPALYGRLVGRGGDRLRVRRRPQPAPG